METWELSVVHCEQSPSENAWVSSGNFCWNHKSIWLDSLIFRCYLRIRYPHRWSSLEAFFWVLSKGCVTAASFRHFFVDRRAVLEFLVRSLDYLIQYGDFYFFEFLSKVVVDDFVQFADRFSKLRIKMVLHTVVRSVIQWRNTSPAIFAILLPIYSPNYRATYTSSTPRLLPTPNAWSTNQDGYDTLA